MFYPRNHLPSLYSIMYWGNTFLDTLHKANVTCQKAFHSVGSTARAHSSAGLQPAPFRMLHRKPVIRSGPGAMQGMRRMKVETAGCTTICMLVQSLLKQHSKVSPNDPSREKSSRVLRGKMLWMWVCNRPKAVEDIIINKGWAHTHQRWRRLFQPCDNKSLSFSPLYLFIFLYLFAAMRLCNFLMQNYFFFDNFTHICNIFCQFSPTSLFLSPFFFLKKKNLVVH